MKAKELFAALEAYQSSKRCVAKYARKDTPKYLMDKLNRLERRAMTRAEEALDQYVTERIVMYFGADGK